ncbi:MAG: hypothetical protein CL846_07180 [Crocinitomicaceae bacterium]|nr:hypothetical protein [Crocinitomicaceae bacterium]|tara:strand:- start:7991 stop:9937 length:1947 start_codon:yes stop_codon:yes gene_type:complete
MRYILLFIISCFFSINIFGTHIIGGDIHVEWTSANTYNIKLRLYRDDVNGLPTATMPTSVSVGVYQIGTNSQTAILTLPRTSLTYVNLGDPCYTPDQNVVHIEEGIFELSSVTIPNYSQGYYLQYENCCRNAVIDNLSVPDSYGISLYAEIPDPSIGQNSTPDFGIYPADAYLCVNNVKNFNFPVTESDGDSLVFSLVNPLDGQTVGGATLPGSGAYPYYPSCVWAPGYSLGNICGGSPAMSIDPITGVITAAPNQIGNFVFAVRVEEYRNGVKLGESRRELQYASLPCTVNNVPQIETPDTVIAFINGDSTCFDVRTYDSDNSVDLYLQISSNEFDVSGNYIQADFHSQSNNTQPCDFTLNMTDSWGDGWDGSGVDVMINGAVVVSNATITGASGSQTFPVSNGDVLSTSWNSSPTALFDTECSYNIQNNNGTIVGTGDYINNISNVIVSTCQSGLTNLDYYSDWNNSGNDITFPTLDSINGFVHGIGEIPMRFCWTPGCYDILQDYEMSIKAYSIGCAGADTSYKDVYISVQVPEGEAEAIPTVFTPNGDNNNDIYQLKGEYDECFDTLTIKIYNRWGQLVFESFDSFFEWDGKDIGGKNCPPGSYYVMVYGKSTGTYGSFGSKYVNGYREPQYLELDNFTIQLFR